MECATVSCDCDDGYSTVLLEKHRKARKEHKCTECKRIIQSGERYLEERILFDGEISVWKTCSDCESIRDNFFTDGWYWGETKWMLEEHIQNSDGDVSESCIAALTSLARERVCLMIERCWEDEDDEDS